MFFHILLVSLDYSVKYLIFCTNMLNTDQLKCHSYWVLHDFFFPYYFCVFVFCYVNMKIFV